MYGGDSSSYFGKLYRIKTYVAATPTTVRQLQKYWWDAAGNMSSREDEVATGTESFSVEGTGGGYSGTVTYTYDGDGKRRKKVEGTPPSTQTGTTSGIS